MNARPRLSIGSLRSGRKRARRAEGVQVDSDQQAEAGSATLQDLVLITGLSGAGKSAAMACFEDAGYFCVDNLPPEMIASLADLFEHEGSKVEHAAVATDVRGGSYFEGLAEVIRDLSNRDLAVRVLFLDADTQALVNRFKETRRRHPLAQEGELSEGIAAERSLLEPIRSLADAVIDTTEIGPTELRRRITADFLPAERHGKLSVVFTTYGFKHGPPRNVDLAFDVRFLPNPHYEPELRDQTGLDAAVREYVELSPGTQDFYDRLIPLLDYLLPAYENEGKSHLTIGIGCTGGRHRSVVVAEHLASIYRVQSGYDIEVVHRDIEKRSRV